MTQLPEGLLAIMQCPECSGELVERSEPPALVCVQCRLAYPIAPGGIPVMLPEEAAPLPEEAAPLEDTPEELPNDG